MVRFLLFIFFLALFFLFFIFTLENLDLVSLNLIVVKYQVPLGLSVLASFLLGALLGILFSISLVLKNKNKVRVLTKKMAVTDKEITSLRQHPIKDSY
jgi:uncharacterized integral membrane protein